jgi:hypothetical protein
MRPASEPPRRCTRSAPTSDRGSGSGPGYDLRGSARPTLPDRPLPKLRRDAAQPRRRPAESRAQRGRSGGVIGTRFTPIRAVRSRRPGSGCLVGIHSSQRANLSDVRLIDGLSASRSDGNVPGTRPNQARVTTGLLQQLGRPSTAGNDSSPSFHDRRPVTPEVAGSSPVAPVSPSPHGERDRALTCPTRRRPSTPSQRQNVGRPSERNERRSSEVASGL